MIKEYAYTIFLAAIFSLSACLNSGAGDTAKDRYTSVNNIGFVIPAGFEKIAVDTEVDEILKIKKAEEMYIIVQQNVSDIISKSSLQSEMSLKLVHDLKFSMVKSNYSGYDEGESRFSRKYGRLYSMQHFKTEEYFGEGVYYYCVVETANDYVELLVGGRANLMESQKKILEFFISKIDNFPKDNIIE